MRAKAAASFAEDKDLSLALFLKDIKAGDDSLATRYGYAIALTEHGDYDKAAEEIGLLLKEFGDNVSVRLIQAENELKADRIAEGLALLQKLYEEQVAQGNHLIDIYYANALVLSRRTEEAIPILRSAIANDPTEPLYHILISRAYGENGDELRSFRSRGEFHYLRGHYEFATLQFKRAAELAETDYDKARIKARLEDVRVEMEELKRL